MVRNRTGMLILLLSLGSSLWAWQDQVLATFDGGQITQKEAEAWLRMSSQRIDDPADLKLLQSLALNLAWFQEAKKRKILEDQALQDRWQVKEGQIANRRLRTHLANGIIFTDEEIQKEFARGNYGGRPEKVRLRQIFKAYPAQADQATKAAAMKTVLSLKERVEKGESFEKLASVESDSQSKHRGGLIGNVAPGDLDPRVEKIIFALKPGGMSKPFATKEGVMLFYCDKRIPALTYPPEEKIRRATRNLRGRTVDKQWAAFLKDQKKYFSIQWPQDKGPVKMTLLGKEVPSSKLLVRLNNAIEGDVTWATLHRTKAEEVLEAFGLERVLVSKLKEHPSYAGTIWETQLQLDYKQYWGRQVLYKDLNETYKRPPQEQLVAYFEANRSKYKIKPQFDMQILSWRFTQENIRQKTMFARQIRQKIVAGEMDMDQAAKKYSEVGSSADGGRIGWMPRNQVAAMGKHILQVVDKLPMNQIGPLVRQDNAIFLIKILGKKPGRLAEFEEVESKVLQKIADDQVQVIQKKMENSWLERINFKKIS